MPYAVCVDKSLTDEQEAVLEKAKRVWTRLDLVLDNLGQARINGDEDQVREYEEQARELRSQSAMLSDRFNQVSPRRRQ